MLNLKSLISAIIIILLTISNNVFASGFQSFEQNVSGMGNSYAGAGSIADDASIEFDNPAGMVRIKHPEITISGVALNAHAHFTATSNKRAFDGAEILGTARKFGQNPLGLNFLPAIHFVTPINQRIFFGFGITVPFGLQTNYDKDSTARYFATKNKIETINIGANLGIKANEKLSFGAGVNAQYLDTELNQQIDGGSLIPGGITGINNDITVKNTAHDWAFGVNAGIMYQFNPRTRAGLSYRSPVKHTPSGKANFSYGSGLNPIIDIPILKMLGYKNGHVSSSITLPDYTVLSLYHEINSKWAAMGSITYTHWSLFKELKLKFNTGLSNVIIHEDFHDTWKFALGLNYMVCDKLLWRFGTAYDQSPVTDRTRTVALPDADRIWISTGGRYQFSPQASLDFGYFHVFIQNGNFNQTGPASSSITGYFHKNYADLFGLQFNWQFL